MKIVVPRKPANVKKADKERVQGEYYAACAEFASQLEAIDAMLDFKMGKRGYCYMLEEKAGLEKGDFKAAEKVIDLCRKSGLLPIHFVADDSERKPKGGEPWVDSYSPEEMATELASDLLESPDYYAKSFWENQEYYVEVAVEKADLVGLFQPVCEEYYVPISNTRGWGDINARAHRMKRYQRHQAAGRKCVLLYCGDCDPGGYQISDHLRNNLRDLERAVGWSPDDLTIVRFGINPEFIDEQNIPWIDNLITSSGQDLADPSSKDYNKPHVAWYREAIGEQKCEANALVTRVDEGRQLVREAIEQFVSAEDVDAHRDYIEEQIDELKLALPDAIQELLGES